MSSVTYKNFDLEILPDKGGYRARVLNSPEGPAAVDFKNPFSAGELKGFLDNVPFSQNVRRTDVTPEKAAKELGGRLFTAVFQGDVLSCLRSCLAKSSAKEKGLRIRLRLNEVPEMTSLPWEYLFNPMLKRFLALSPKTPILRYPDLSESSRIIRIKPPLRILVVVGYSKRLDTRQELEGLTSVITDLQQRGVHVELDQLRRCTLAELEDRLQKSDRQYHIFHFIGHGEFNEGAQGGVLLFKNAQQQREPVTGEELGVVLSNHNSLRLVIINACEGARSPVQDPSGGVAQSLMQQGIPAVIAMQFEITDPAAITFSHSFYQAIANGERVDAALGQARLGMFTQRHGVEWATPVLYSRSTDGRLFKITRAVPPPPQLESPEGPVDPQSPFYVQRYDELGISESEFMEVIRVSGGQMLIINAPGQMGRSTLLNKIRTTAETSGKRVVFIDFESFGQLPSASAGDFFRQFCRDLTYQFEGLADQVDEYWKKNPGFDLKCCTDYLCNYLLRLWNKPLVLLMDNVDSIFSCDFRSDFFRLLQYWYKNRLTSHPILKQLDIVFATAASRSQLIETDQPNVAPYNVGNVFKLSDFAPQQVADLNRRHGSPFTTDRKLRQLMNLVGGHPFLIRWALYLVASQRFTAPRLFAHPMAAFNEHLSYQFSELLKKPELASGFRQVVLQQSSLDNQVRLRLLTTGLIRLENEVVKPRCQLYERYFREQFDAGVH